jgi:hypothetical protein
MHQAPRAISRLEIKSRDFEPSTLSPCETMTQPLPEEIAERTQVRGQDPFPYEENRREPLGAYLVSAVMLLSNAVSSLAAKRS